MKYLVWTQKFSWYLLGFFVFALLVSFAIFKVNDADTVQYLANGKQIVESGFSRSCVFSYASDACQIPFAEWLFHVMAYGIYQAGSWVSLGLFQLVLVFVVAAVVIVHQYKSRASLTSVVLVLGVAVFVAMERFALRADLITLPLAAGLYFLITDIFKNFTAFSKKSLYVRIGLVLLIQLLWTNMHGSFPLGWWIVGAFFVGEIISKAYYQIKKSERFVWDNRLTVLAGTLLGVVLVSFINPYGLSAIIWPFKFFFGASEFHSQLEFQSAFAPANFERLSVVLFKWLFFGTVILFLFTARKWKWPHFLILAAFAYLAVTHVRYIALFAVFAGLIIPAYVDIAHEKIGNLIQQKFLAHAHKVFVILGCIVALVGLFFTTKTILAVTDNSFYISDQRSRRFGFGLSELEYPIGAADFIVQNNLAGNMFNDYQSGTYINFALYPDHKAFIDGHTYTLESLQYYKKVMSGEVAYTTAAEKYGISYFLINYNSPDSAQLVSSLFTDPNWKPVYVDEVALLFLKNTPENQELIARFFVDFAKPETLSNLVVKTDDVVTARSNRGFLFSLLGMHERAIAEFEKAVEADPTSYVAVTNLAAAYHKQNRTDIALSTYRKALALEDGYAPTHFNLGVLYENNSNFSEAKNEFKKTISINKKYPLANYHLGLIAEKETQKFEAQTYFEKELAFNGAPEVTEALRRMLAPSQTQESQKHIEAGVGFAQKGEFDRAILEFNKAIELESKNAVAYFNLGNIFLEQKKFEQARDAYTKAAEFDPSLADAHFNLGFIYRNHIINNAKTKEHWLKYLELAPDAPEAASIKENLERLK